MSRHLLLHHGEASYALPVERVRGVAPAVAAVPLPRSPSWLEGVAAYGRDIVPQIALGLLTARAPGGAVAVVADSAEGKVALRVDAADRVVEIASRSVAPPGEPDLVCGVARRGKLAIRVLDLGRLVLPVTDAAPRTGETLLAQPRPAPRRIERGVRPSAAMLACAVGKRQVLLPLGRVAAIERAAPGRSMIELGGGSRPNIAITLRHDGRELALGVDRVIGLRSAVADGAEVLDVAALAEGATAADAEEAPAARSRQSALLLVSAGHRSALVPRAKITRIGQAEHWCALPGTGAHASGVTVVGGDILPALDLAGLFGDAEARRPIVMAFEARGSRWAMACDHVSERHAGIEGRPRTVDGLAMLGEARVAEGLLPVLDIDRLPLPGLPA